MPIDRTPWTDESVFPWGRHEGVPLQDVPPAYLLWLFEQPWIKDWPGLYAYLKSNEDLLLEEKNKGGEDPDEPEGYASFEDYRRDYRGF